MHVVYMLYHDLRVIENYHVLPLYDEFDIV